MFDPSKTYKFRHLQNAGLVRDRDDLQTKQKFGFPVGRLLTPRDRQWTGKELNDYLDSRPTTQAEFNALPDRPAKTKPDIPKTKLQALEISKDAKKTKKARREEHVAA